MAKGSHDPQPPHVPFLNDIMHSRGWSVRKFASVVGVVPNTVRYWLNGHRPPIDTVDRIATSLDISLTRLLERFGYAPDLENILDYNDQLQDENARLAAVKVQVQANVGAGRVGVVADALARAGKYSFRIHPWWRGTGTYRRHFADFVVVHPKTTDGALVSRAMVKDDILAEYAYVAAWFDGPEN